MDIYNQVRSVPPDAVSSIMAGRLKGKSDINPMWRIKKMTELFGPCGIGWKYDITKQWIEVGANGEAAAFCNISLYIKYKDEWSAAIPGTGGSAFVTAEKNGLYTSDECYKMALTDAISVACKALGVAADVYWGKNKTKYDTEPPKDYKCCDCGKPFTAFTDKNGKTWSAGQVYHMSESKNTDKKARCRECMRKAGTEIVKQNNTNGQANG